MLEANAHYRALTFPEPVGPAFAGYAAGMKGVRLPAVGRVEVSIIADELPVLLAFEKGDFDYATVRGIASTHLLTKGMLRPDYAARGIRHIRYPVPALMYTCFNLDDAVVGGSAPDRIALRRAIGLGFNVQEYLRVVQGGDGIPATQLLPPGVDGHDATADKRALYDPAAARALLDRFGYVDRDGDGYRERPDGTPLVLTQNVTSDTRGRETGELWLASMKAIGLRIRINSAPFAELLKQMKAGQLQMFELGSRSPSPSGFEILMTLYGKAPPDTNLLAFPKRRLRRRLRVVRTYAARIDPQRDRAGDVRRRRRIRADRLPSVPRRKRISAALAQWVLPRQFRIHLEVRRHRPRPQARRAQVTTVSPPFQRLRERLLLGRARDQRHLSLSSRSSAGITVPCSARFRG